MTEHELDKLLQEYGGAVRAVCRAILPGHPQDAEEAEADTFYKLWRGAGLPADPAHRRRLVVLTARQCAIDRYRALLRRSETLPLDDRDDAELAVALESHLESRELMAQIMALPPPVRLVRRQPRAAPQLVKCVGLGLLGVLRVARQNSPADGPHRAAVVPQQGVQLVLCHGRRPLS